MPRILLPLVVLVTLLAWLSGCHKGAPEGLPVFHWVTPEAVTVEAPPDPTAIAIEAEEAGQTDCAIKVNVSKDGDIVYHLPGQAYYERVKIDEAEGDFYACSEAAAQEAGARKSLR